MTRKILKSLTLALSLAVVSSLTAPLSTLAVENISDSKDVSLTIYNQNFGLVRDSREITLADGINYVRFEDVAAGIDPTTVSFTSLTAPNAVAVKEQNYQFDLMDMDTILSRSVGKTVKFNQYLSGGGVREITGVLLSSPSVSVSDSNGNVSEHRQATVVKTGSGIVVGAGGELEITELPDGLVSKPSLFWKLACDKAGQHNAEISYQTQGLNWKCDYVAVANADDSALDLTSWVTLDNKSGATYKNAALKLMAGDVHKVQNENVMYLQEARSMASDAAQPQFGEQAFAEYHLYTLKGKTDVRDNETKQMTLFNAAQVPVKKLYIFDSAGGVQPYYGGGGDQSKKINVKLELANSQANNLGMPMPKGKVRVYKKDNDGALQFVGEDLIDHTPKDEKVRVYLGDAFDIVGERTQTGQQQVSDRVQRLSYSISIRNHKKDAVTVTSVEHAWGDWKVINSSMPFTKKDAHTFEFAIKVAPDSEEKVTYTIEIR